MEYWQKYNQDISKLASVISNHNKENKFNYIESDLYNHVHDLLTITILLCGGKRTKILDYGSNIIPWSNIKNKINVHNLDITVYDPFCANKEKKFLDYDFAIDIVNSIKDISSQSFDIIIFGSSSQYIDNFFTEVLNNSSLSSNLFLFTHTPFSLKETFVSNQYTDFKGKQIIRSFKHLIDLMLIKQYELIFKSILPSELASVDEEKVKDTIYANLIFRRRL